LAVRHAATGEVRLSNATMEQVTRVTAAARTKTSMEAGRWETALRLVSADLSLPEGPERENQLKAIREQERSATGCRTADELKPLDFASLEKLAGQCTIPRYIQADGKVDVEIHCGEGAAKTVLVATGALSRTGFDVTIDQVTGTRGAQDYLAMKLQATGKRLGDCPVIPKAG
jgi:hypothetical protein